MENCSIILHACSPFANLIVSSAVVKVRGPNPHGHTFHIVLTKMGAFCFCRRKTYTKSWTIYNPITKKNWSYFLHILQKKKRTERYYIWWTANRKSAWHIIQFRPWMSLGVIKHHRPGATNKTNLFSWFWRLHVWDQGAVLDTDEGPLSGLQTATLLYLHPASSLVSLLLKILIPSQEPHPHDLIQPQLSPKGLVSKHHPIGS